MSEISFWYAMWGVVPAGGYVCAVLTATSSELTCMLPVAPVGRDLVIVSLFGINSTDTVYIDRMCGEGYFALPGSLCQPCPAVSHRLLLYYVIGCRVVYGIGRGCQ